MPGFVIFAVVTDMTINDMVMRFCVPVLILTVFLASSMTASAQYNDVYRRGADFYAGGELLSEDRIVAMLDGSGYTLADVERYQKGFRTGKGLLIGFGSLTGAGLLTLGVGATGVMVEAIAAGIGGAMLSPLYALGGKSPDMSFDSKFAGVAVGGLCATCVGVLGMVAGTTVLCISKKHLNSVADACGSACGTQLSFGAQQYGVGLAVAF